VTTENSHGVATELSRRAGAPSTGRRERGVRRAAAGPFPRYTALREGTPGTLRVPGAQPLAPGGALRSVASRERIYRWALALADGTAAAAAVVVALSLIGGFALEPEFLIVVPLIIAVAKVQGLYDHDELVIHKSTLDEFPSLVNLATLFALVTWLGRHYVVRGTPPTVDLLSLWCLLIISLAVARFAGRSFACRRAPVERCLLIGSPLLHDRVAAKLDGLRHVELVASIPVESVAADHDELHALADELDVHRVLIAPADETGAAAMELVRAATGAGLRVSLLPSALGAVGSSVAFDDLGGMPLLGVPRFGLSRSSLAIKRAFDLLGACVLLLFAAPVMALLAILVRLDSAGPTLFRQTRVGRDGRQFEMLKFRSMVDGADAMKSELRKHNEADDLFKIANDPRMTRVGRLLRRTSLDELPQLLNVLRGDMSLVGPRPLVVDEDERVTGFDRRRLHLTPGMTGRWQTLGSARIPLSEMVKIDYLYVANWSLWSDVKILCQTVGFVLHRRGL
jgi:exopolysaccharide biosynthesis polyprenyl glycosylphosphotransferase